jgi:hypothetical protein
VRIDPGYSRRNLGDILLSGYSAGDIDTAFSKGIPQGGSSASATMTASINSIRLSSDRTDER